MKGKRLLKSMNQVDEQYAEGVAPIKRSISRSIWIKWTAVVAGFAVVAIILIPMLYDRGVGIPSGVEVAFGGMGDRWVYHTLQEVEEEAGIIVEAVPRKVLGQEVNTFHFYNKEKNEVVESPSYGYTKWEIEVTKVYKGDVEVGDKLVFLHSYYIWTYSDGSKVFYTFSSRKPEVKNKKYIMFLKYYEPFEGYCSVGDYEAVFPVPNAKMKKKVEKGTVERSDLEVYDLDDMHYLIPIYTDMVKKYYID